MIKRRPAGSALTLLWRIGAAATSTLVALRLLLGALSFQRSDRCGKLADVGTKHQLFTIPQRDWNILAPGD